MHNRNLRRRRLELPSSLGHFHPESRCIVPGYNLLRINSHPTRDVRMSSSSFETIGRGAKDARPEVGKDACTKDTRYRACVDLRTHCINIVETNPESRYPYPTLIPSHEDLSDAMREYYRLYPNDYLNPTVLACMLRVLSPIGQDYNTAKHAPPPLSPAGARTAIIGVHYLLPLPNAPSNRLLFSHRLCIIPESGPSRLFSLLSGKISSTLRRNLEFGDEEDREAALYMYNGCEWRADQCTVCDVWGRRRRRGVVGWGGRGRRASVLCARSREFEVGAGGGRRRRRRRRRTTMGRRSGTRRRRMPSGLSLLREGAEGGDQNGLPTPPTLVISIQTRVLFSSVAGGKPLQGWLLITTHEVNGICGGYTEPSSDCHQYGIAVSPSLSISVSFAPTAPLRSLQISYPRPGEATESPTSSHLHPDSSLPLDRRWRNAVSPLRRTGLVALAAC
ncbi:hypothetical protein R3P38DRAFT_2791313 [Favolaschia claudopus]|uniref:Uncharacterized protein n=1 Tax=Favolaschia claudopus TaxID=2862362 RepID=A0AAW0AGM4_9AGAR